MPSASKAVKASTPVETRGRKSVNLETYTAKLDALIQTLTDEIERRSREKEKGVRFLRSVRKEVKDLLKQTPKIANRKAARPNTHSGFDVRKRISDELSAFLKVKSGTKLTGHEVNAALCVYVHLNEGESRENMLRWAHLNKGGKRNLQSADKRTVIEPDDALRKLLRYDRYVRDVAAGKIMVKRRNEEGRKEPQVETDPSLYYYVMQRLVQVHFEPDDERGK